MDPLRRNLLECSECKKTFPTTHQFKQHVNTHDPDAKVKCKVCGKFSKNPASLSCHMTRMHRNQVRPLCNICDKTFSSSDHLQRHINHVHSTVDRPRIACTFPGCEKSYLREYEVTKHHKIEHSENPVRFPCPLCWKEFKRRAELESHIFTHTTEKPFRCTICGRRFAQKAYMKRHEVTHLDKSSRETFTCQHCSLTFLSRISLHDHISVVHKNQRDYPCRFCGKKFTTSSCLRCHVEARHLASQEIIHSCDKCEYRTHSKVNLSQHVRRIHFAIWHECYFCKKQFAGFKRLVQHCSQHHCLEK